MIGPCLLWLLSTGAGAPLPRVAVVLAEPAQIAGAAEHGLLTALLDSGLVELLDEGQRRKLRAVTDQGALANGSFVVPPTLSGFDLDYLVLGRAQVVELQGRVLSDKVARYDLRLELRVLEADTARVRTVITAGGEGLAISPAAALAQAALNAGRRAVVQLKAALDAAPNLSKVDLEVEGVPGATEAEALAVRLQSVLGLRSVRWAGMERGRARFRIEGSPRSTQALAPELESASIRVLSLSESTITGVWSEGLAVEGPRQAPAVLQIQAFNVPAIFLAQAERSARQGLGTLTVQNPGRRPVEGASLWVEAPELWGPRLEIPLAKLGAKAERQVSLPAVLEGARVEEARGRRSVAIRAAVRAADGTLGPWSRVMVETHDRWALDWSEPRTVGAFVAADEPAVRALAGQAQAAASHLDHPLSALAAIWAELRAQGLRYRTDPAAPSGLDEVRRPTETLLAQAGDCEDLAVLVVATAEAAGIPAMLVLTPGHVLVALSTGLPIQAESALSAQPGDLIAHQGQLWLPLEATALDADLDQAWARAIQELARSPDLQRIVIREAWAEFPPRVLSFEALKLRSAGEGAGRELSGLVRRRTEALRLALDQEQRPAARAVLLAAQGDGAAARALLGPPAQVGDVVALNNLANLDFLEGAVAEADRGYGRALQRAGRAAPPGLVSNAALAALARGDRRRFAQHVIRLLDEGHEDWVQGLASGQLPASPNRGSGAALLARDLEVELQAIYAARKRPLVVRRRAADAQAAAPVAWLVHWMVP